MGICYIVGAGECAPLPKPRGDDFVIAADGGYDSLREQGILPNLLVGDLDSIKNLPNGIELLRFPEKKNETDMHLAYLEGARRGYTSFMLYGGTGGRCDHSLANYSLLLFIRSRGHTATLVGRDYDAHVIKDSELTLSGKCGAHLSVFAFGGTAWGVSIKGAEYELSDGTLTPDFPLGVSNRFCNTPVTVSVKRGALLVISEKIPENA